MDSKDSKSEVMPETPALWENPSLSKNQLKKMAKRARYDETKSARRAKEKEKRKLKHIEAKLAGKEVGPSRKMLKSAKMADSTCKLRVAFDLSLARFMTRDELSKTLHQLHRCYTLNRRAKAPLQLYICGYSDALKAKMSDYSGCLNWDVNFNQTPYNEIFPTDEIIYMTSESSNVLDELDDKKVYIIGGLVDHNRLKGVCHDEAVKLGVNHARLPLDVYCNFETRAVLTIDQVYSMFLGLSEGKSWGSAILDAVPKRKGFELKETTENL